MAIYRNVSMSFWTDSKVVDDFTPEDRYFYLYLFTNPHTNLCGCYEISMKQVALETGYSQDSIANLIKRFSDVHNLIRYSEITKEVLLLNWSKYNWTASEKFRKPLVSQIQQIKNDDFRSYLTTIYNGVDTVSIPYQYGIDTSVTVTDTVTVSDNREAEEKSDLDKALDDFKAHRRKLKSPMTDRAYDLMLKKLDKLSGGDDKKKIEIINQSIGNGWKGVFELRQSISQNKFNNAPARERDIKELELELLQTN